LRVRLSGIIGLGWSQALGIDFGTANLRIALPGGDVALNAPSLLVQRPDSPSILAWGEAARGLIGDEPELGAWAEGATGTLLVRRPIRNGGVADLDASIALLRQALAHLPPGHRLWRLLPVVASCSGTARDFEERALVAALREAGVARLELRPASRAAAVGAGVPLDDGRANLVVDLGAGATDIGVLWNGNLVVRHALRAGGEHLDACVVRLLRREYSLAVGPMTAESLKCRVGVGGFDETEGRVDVPGRDVRRGQFVSRSVPVTALQSALAAPLAEIGAAVQAALEATPAGLNQDLMERGLVLVGGGARLRGLTAWLAGLTGLPVTVAEAPETCVVRGLVSSLRPETQRQPAWRLATGTGAFP